MTPSKINYETRCSSSWNVAMQLILNGTIDLNFFSCQSLRIYSPSSYLHDFIYICHFQSIFTFKSSFRIGWIICTIVHYVVPLYLMQSLVMNIVWQSGFQVSVHFWQINAEAYIVRHAEKFGRRSPKYFRVFHFLGRL